MSGARHTGTGQEPGSVPRGSQATKIRSSGGPLMQSIRNPAAFRDPSRDGTIGTILRRPREQAMSGSGRATGTSDPQSAFRRSGGRLRTGKPTRPGTPREPDPRKRKSVGRWGPEQACPGTGPWEDPDEEFPDSGPGGFRPTARTSQPIRDALRVSGPHRSAGPFMPPHLTCVGPSVMVTACKSDFDISAPTRSSG